MPADPSGYRAPLAGRGRILVPDGTTRVRGGLWVGSACTRRGLLIDWLLGRSTQLTIRGLSTRSALPELPDLDWHGWRASVVPGSAEPPYWIVGLPRDRRRQRFQLFIPDDDGRLRAVAKFTRNPHSKLMVLVRRRLATVTPSTFATPTPMDEGTIGNWWYSVDSAVQAGLYRPARLEPLARRAVVGEYQDTLADLVTEPGRIVHGDFGPWNVRRGPGAPVMVFDWEDVTSGPDGADELWHELNLLLVRGPRREDASTRIRRSLRHHSPETIGAAASFWLERLDRPEAPEIRDSLVSGRAKAGLASGQRRVLQDLARG